jgi:hypothetical protein
MAVVVNIIETLKLYTVSQPSHGEPEEKSEYLAA